MENNKNFILAMVLSLAVLLGWQYFYVGPRVEAQRKAAEIELQRKQAAENGKGADSTVPAAGAAGGDSTLPSAGGSQTASNEIPGTAKGANRDVAISENVRVNLETAILSGSINLEGARIDDLRLKEFHETVDKSSPTIVLLSPGRSADGYFAEFGYVSALSDVKLPGPKTVWKQKGSGTLSEAAPVTLTWTNDSGLTFEREISIDDGYMFSIKDSIVNNGASSIAVKNYGRIARLGTPKTQGIFVLHEGLLGVVGESGLQEVDYDDLEEERVIKGNSADRGWIGITDKYWATALIPGQPFEARYAYFDTARKQYQADYTTKDIAIAPGGTVLVENKLFAGAKEVDVIDGYEASLNIPQFDLMIDWGWFYFLTKPLFKVLDWIYNVIGNFGVAILILTVLLKILFFPLANKSYASMAKMKNVQPKMLEIKERFGDDRAKQQQAMMELYKKEKINPAAGCWPMLIQIPVFFALYKVLYVTLEMRHAPFFGWIQDLAAPDPTSIFNLFGLLPFEVPAFLMIGVWPLLMGITMFLQMRMNPAPPDPTQQMIFTWMPVVFTFMLASFPAGLVIYWAWNNFLSIIQQGTIMKKHGTKIELWDNLMAMFKKKEKET